VLPIAGVCGVLYVTTVLWLFGKENNTAAVALAWAPVLLMVIGVPALQVAAAIFGFVLGK
jgi:hypothetical protein